MEQANLFPDERDRDITYGKHKGNPESNAAFEKALPYLSQDRATCYSLIAERPRTAKECAELMGKSFNAVSGRLSELKRLGLIERTGDTRDGSAVLKAKGKPQ